MIRPEVITWQEAYLIAHRDILESFAALSDGDVATARALNESASDANKLAALLLGESGQ